VSRIWRAFGLKPHRSRSFTLRTGHFSSRRFAIGYVGTNVPLGDIQVGIAGLCRVECPLGGHSGGDSFCGFSYSRPGRSLNDTDSGRALAYDPMRMVDGELDNSFFFQDTPISISVLAPVYP